MFDKDSTLKEPDQHLKKVVIISNNNARGIMIKGTLQLARSDLFGYRTRQCCPHRILNHNVTLLMIPKTKDIKFVLCKEKVGSGWRLGMT